MQATGKGGHADPNQIHKTQADRSNQPSSSSQTIGIASHVEGKGNKNDEGMLSLNQTSLDGWVIDSGATDHMTFSEKDLSEFKKPRTDQILNANGIEYPVEGAGNVKVTQSLVLNNTLLVPSLKTRLVSVGQITEDLNCMVIMFPDFCIFQDILTKEIIGRGSKKGRLYHLEDLRVGRTNLANGCSKSENKIWTWHRRLGHPSFGYMKRLLPHLFSGLDISMFNCETCIKAKSHRVSYNISLNKCEKPFDLIHSDVWGPSPVDSVYGYRWFVLFIDDCTRMTWVYLLKRKDEVAEVFKMFYKMVQTQFGKIIRFFRSDNGGEFVNKILNSFFVDKGIIHETTCVGTPQQNGVAERKNRHILETARALLFENHVPQKFWDCAVTMAVYVINRLPSKSNDFQTPLKKLAQFVTISVHAG